VTDSQRLAAAIVLCGGRSGRMGRDKLSLPFGDETLLERVIRIVRGVLPDVVLVAREGQHLPEGLEVAVVRDSAEGLGPLAGIAAGLSALDAERAFVAAGDMPLLRPSLISSLLEFSDGYEACVPLVNGFAVPTCAVYLRGIAEIANALVSERRLHPGFLLDRVHTRYVDAAELREADPALESFRDCNTPEHYAEALRMVRP
jgi:molybdopterin-guanine dinucleotide biosynthesis protein A